MIDIRISRNLLLAFAVMFSGALLADTAASTDMDGLELLEKDRRGEIYVAPDVSWEGYEKIILEDVVVAFRKDWLRDQNRSRKSLSNRVTTSDMERIKSNVADLFDEVFVEELAERGNWPLVNESAEDTLRIKPYIVDLDVYAPDIRGAGGTRSYADSAGKMTLKLEIYDSASGAVLARASNRQESQDRGYVTWATAGSNKAEARIMLQKWAKALNLRLREATGTDSGD